MSRGGVGKSETSSKNEVNERHMYVNKSSPHPPSVLAIDVTPSSI